MYNIYNQPMRDQSDDYTIGWLWNGRYLERAPNLSTGVAGLGEAAETYMTWPGVAPLAGMGHAAETYMTWPSVGPLAGLGEVVSRVPKVGQAHIIEAMQDPEARPILVQLLRRRDAEDALTTQAQNDVAEAVRPTGKVIVFKRFARVLAPKVRAAQDAIIDALPAKDTEEAADARDIVRWADDPKKALTLYYEQIALEAMAPDDPEFLPDPDELAGYDDEDEALDSIGLGITKKAKKILKGVAIGVGVAAAAVLTAGVALPAIGAALPAIGGVVSSAAGALFGGRGKATPHTTVPTEAPYYDPSIPAGSPGGPPLVSMPGPAPTAPPEETGATPGAPAAPIDLSWVGGVALEIYKARKGGAPPQQVDQMKAEQVERLVAQGIPRHEAVVIVERAIGGVAQQDAATGGQIAPTPPEEAGERVRVASMGMGMGISPGIILAGLALIALTAGGGGTGRRRARRNPMYKGKWRSKAQMRAFLKSRLRRRRR